MSPASPTSSREECAECSPPVQHPLPEIGSARTVSANWKNYYAAVVSHSSSPILIADNDGQYREASVGATKLLGLPREKLIGKKLDDFAEPAFTTVVANLWQAFIAQGEQQGTLRLVGADGTPHEVEYRAKGNILPVRHVLALRDKSRPAEPDRIPAWVQEYALFLLDSTGAVAAWYAGAVRIYGYSAEESVGRNASFLYGDEAGVRLNLEKELTRAAASGHIGTEGWQTRQDGAGFGANTITMALKDETGPLHGFARVVRDFTERHERDEKLRRSRARLRPLPAGSMIACIVSGEFDRVPELTDPFLDLVGYTREDLAAGRMSWPDLTPAEYALLDELAHEEGLRFGACTPSSSLRLY